MEKPSTKKPMNILKTMVFLENFMKNLITIVLPEKLLNYLKNQENWYKGNSCIDEQIADIINDHLVEYSKNYFTSCKEWEEIKAKTYTGRISNKY